MGFRNRMNSYLPTPDDPKPEGTPSAEGGGGTGGAPANGGGQPPQQPAAPSNGGGGNADPNGGQQAPQGPTQGGSGEIPIDQLPEAWQKHIRDLRTENQQRRQAQPDYDKYKQFYDGIQGVVSPDNQKDPEKLAADLQAERERTRESDLKLAIYQTAGEHGADPSALLDSASFLGEARKLDDFGQVGDLIKNAVEKNGRLKAGGSTRQKQQAPGSSGSTEFPGGAGNGQQLTRDDLKNMSPEQIEKARTEGRLKTLLGG